VRAACEVLLELSGPAMILADLLLVPLDRREEWHRYHHLFRDMLLAELERLRPGLTPVLRRRAAGWCLANGWPEEALEYSMAAGDIDVVAGLVEGRWGWPATAGGAGLREVDGRCLRGTPQVERGHEACWQIAAWMARHVGGRAQVARGGLAPLSSRESVLPADHGRTARTGPVVPVPGSPGNLRRECERWPGGSDFQGGTVSGVCPAGEYRHRRRRAGGSAACPAGSRRQSGR
jgi:hypothetical protein